MKKMQLLIAAIFVLAFGACSKDESTPTQISEIEEKRYNPDGTFSKTYHYYKGGNLSKTRIYNTANFFTHQHEYTYYSNGLLMNVNKKSANGQTISTYTYNYDNYRRLMHMSMGSYYVNFTYDDQSNTVLAERLGDSPENKTFYFNADGAVYSEVAGANTYDVTYDGHNALSCKKNGLVINTHEYFDGYEAMQSESMKNEPLMNEVLRANALAGAENAIATKLLKRSVFGQDVTDYEYTFNGADLPKTRKEYMNGILIREWTYSYK
jgi:hypothetical protein